MPVALTAATIKAAIRDSRAGKRWAKADGLMPGLQLRAQPTGARWTVRGRLHDKQRRWDIGGVCEGDEDIHGLACLMTARSRAIRVKELCRQNLTPDYLVREFTTGMSIVRQEALAVKQGPPSWLFEKAKQEFLAHVLGKKRADTHRDYAGKLRAPELDRFNDLPVASITRNQILMAVAAIHGRGAETMAEGVLRVLKSMWTFLADGGRREKTSVVPNLLLRAKAPDRTRNEIGDPNRIDEDKERGDAPPEIELGRALAIARAGVLPDRISLGLQFFLASIQRRRAVIGANRWRFKSYAETPDEEAWFVPPYFRKSGSKRGNRSHLVPLVGWGAEAVRKLDRLSESEDGSGWLFPGRRSRRMISEGVSADHADAGLLNDYLSVLPGVNFSPQCVRYAFSTYGERDLGFRKSEAKVILDHMEGTEPDDVTGKFYSSDPAIRRKREMITLWAGWLDEWCAKAIAADPILSDREALVEAIYRERYSEEQLTRRIEYRSRRDRPLWNHLRRVEFEVVTLPSNIP
jgi:integrase